MAKRIKMLKPGTFTAMNGKKYTFTEADLRATAVAYDPTLFAAPIVKGHPEHDAPAYGRIYAADFADGHLLGTPGKVDPAFAEEVNAGRFDQVSLSLYPPDHPSNPVPGVYYPRHLGFLGAMPPAVKGLGTVIFAANEEGIISFAEMDMSPKGGTKKMDVKNRAQFCADCGEKCCMPACPTGAITMNADKGAIIDPAKCTVCMKCCEACCMMQGPVYGMQVANYAEKEHQGLLAENAAFAEGLVKEGKLLPANKGAVVAILDFCTKGEAIEFGEGDARKSQAPVEIFKALLQAGPKVIEFGELVTGGNPETKTESAPTDITKYI